MMQTLTTIPPDRASERSAPLSVSRLPAVEVDCARVLVDEEFLKAWRDPRGEEE